MDESAGNEHYEFGAPLLFGYHCYSGTTMFYESEKTSKDIHDGYFIYNLINTTIEKLREKYVVQVVTDNASNNIAASKLLDVRRPHIF